MVEIETTVDIVDKDTGEVREVPFSADIVPLMTVKQLSEGIKGCSEMIGAAYQQKNMMSDELLRRMQTSNATVLDTAEYKFKVKEEVELDEERMGAELDMIAKVQWAQDPDKSDDLKALRTLVGKAVKPTYKLNMTHIKKLAERGGQWARIINDPTYVKSRKTTLKATKVGS